MKPLILMYGGVHDDPGSRQKFVEELAKQETPPHFVAVEWEKCVFERIVKYRPWIERELESRWSFLDREDRRELSLALAWEGDAYTERFPGVEELWLETGFQEAYLRRRCEAGADELLEERARNLLVGLSTPCRRTLRECMANADPPPDPRSKKELIERVARKMWSDVIPEVPENFERDKRWEATISERSSGLRGGWIAVVVGWPHADPTGDSQRLHALLSSNGFRLIPVCLASEP